LTLKVTPAVLLAALAKLSAGVTAKSFLSKLSDGQWPRYSKTMAQMAEALVGED